MALDSGAEANCITMVECKRLHLTINPTQHTAVAVDKKTQVPVLGEITTSFERNGLTFHFEGLVCAELTNSIIGGVPFLKQNNVVQELNNRRIVVHKDGKSHYIMEVPSMAPSTRATQSRVMLLTEFTRSTTILPGEYIDIKLSPDQQPDQSFLLEPTTENKDDSWIPQEVQAVGNVIRATNYSHKPIIIPNDTHMVRVRSVHGPPVADQIDPPPHLPLPLPCQSDAPDYENLQEITIDPSLTKHQKEKLLSIHKKHHRVFNGDLTAGYNGRSGDFQVNFNWIQNTRPPVNNSKAPNFCKRKEDKDLLQSMIDRLESQKKCAKARDLGIIPRFASPIMLVKKNKVRNLKPGEYEEMSIPEKIKYNRFIQCLQKLNEYVEKIPAENIDLEETVYKVGSAECVITGDLTDSFQQRWICSDKQPYFAFHSPYKGTYLMLRSSQGFLNQSEELHGMVSNILHQFVQDGWCMIFHDNIYVTGPDVDSTINRWAKVLSELDNNNLKISPDKTFCFPAELELLGWIKKGRFLHPDPHRQNALLKADLPSTTKQLRSYLGSYQTFYKCKPKIREILGPLQELTSSGESSKKIVWTPELIDVFKKSKTELQKLDNLYVPDPNDQLVATFDYSEKGLSGTLWAKVGEEYFTVTNVSVKCPDGMKGWPPCDGEAAAVCVTTKSPHMRGPILSTTKTVFALVDNKTVYEASKLLKKGQLSTSERVTKLLTSTSDLKLEFRHNRVMRGKMGLG